MIGLKSSGARIFAFLTLCLLLHAATSALILTTLNYPTSNDEYKHLSYVFQVERDRQLFPDYHDLYLAAPEKAGVPLSKRSDLKHPAFFY